MKARVQSIRLDARENPEHATVKTRHGVVRVRWLDVAGDRCWFSSGTEEARREAVPAIKRIEEMCESLR